MKIIEAMTRIRAYFPKVQLGDSSDGRLAKAVHDLAEKPEPGSLGELVRQLDELGLWVRDNKVVMA